MPPSVPRRVQRPVPARALLPGRTHVEEGVDEHSRSCAVEVAGQVSARSYGTAFGNWIRRSAGLSPLTPSPPSPSCPTLSSLVFSPVTPSHALRPRKPSPCRTRPAPCAAVPTLHPVAPQNPLRLPLPPSSTPSLPRPALTARALSSSRFHPSPSPPPRGTSSSAHLSSATARAAFAYAANHGQRRVRE